jgi:hypothetical protein
LISFWYLISYLAHTYRLVFDRTKNHLCFFDPLPLPRKNFHRLYYFLYSITTSCTQLPPRTR